MNILRISIIFISSITTLSYSMVNSDIDVPASGFYQELGKEALKLVGVEDTISINKTDFDNIFGASQSRLKKIWINEDKLRDRPYVFKKFIMCHEAAHIKHNDSMRRESKGQEFSTEQAEREADLAACQAMNCGDCMNEVASNFRYIHNEQVEHVRSELGYLTSQELYGIAKEFNRNGAICSFHGHENKIISMLNTLFDYWF